MTTARALAGRIGQALLVVLLVVSLTFVLVRVAPGGPFDAERGLPPEVRAALERAYALDAPLGVQYLTYMERVLLHGDLGPSLSYRDFSVREVLAQSLPTSLALGAGALLVALVVGLAAGALAARRRGSWIDTLVMGAATLGLALPNFVLAALLVLVLAFHLELFPVAGRGGWTHLVLPALALGLPAAAVVARLFRAGLIETLHEPYVRTATAKGLSPALVLARHAARPALLPVVAWLAPAAAGILTGSLVVERVFALPGMGAHFVESAFAADYNLAVGAVLVYTALLATFSVIADVVALLLDPRVGAP